MRNFNYSNIENFTWDTEIVKYISSIYNEKGKQELYLKTSPKELEKLIDIAKIQSTEKSNEIEGICTTNIRIKQLVQEKTTPKNRDEEEIAGYRDVLNIIHESFDAIPLSKNYILQLHKILYKHTNNDMGGKTKNVQNYISAVYKNGKSELIFTPLAPYETEEALTIICDEYNKAISNPKVEPLILIPTFIHDFLCIHPFLDGNGRMSRLLTTLLLYHNRFLVGKYISLEAKIADNKDQYYNSLRLSQEGWHEGQENKLPFIKYLLNTILDAYRNFEDRYEIVEDKESALKMVQKAVQLKIGKFTKQDIIELCPSLSSSSVEKSLKEMVTAQEIMKVGNGRGTYYFALK